MKNELLPLETFYIIGQFVALFGIIGALGAMTRFLAEKNGESFARVISAGIFCAIWAGIALLAVISGYEEYTGRELPNSTIQWMAIVTILLAGLFGIDFVIGLQKTSDKIRENPYYPFELIYGLYQKYRGKKKPPNGG